MIGIGVQGSALEIHRMTRWKGEGRVAKILAAVAVLGLVGFSVAPWQQNAVGKGKVIAFSPNERELQVQAPVKGRVVRWLHQEGDQVQAGEPIVELSDNDPKVLRRFAKERDAVVRRVTASSGSVKALQDKLDSTLSERRLTLQALRSQIAVAVSKAEASALRLEAAVAQEKAATQQLKRVTKLHRKGLSSERDLELARRNAAQARAQRLEAKANLQAARADAAARRAERESQESKLTAAVAGVRDEIEMARSKQADAEASLEQVERELARQNSLVVRAPQSGMLTSVRARERTAFVKQGQLLAVIVPRASRRAVELAVAGVDAPLVVEGQPVRLQFEGWPAIQFGGWPEAAVGTFHGEVAFVSAHAQPDGTFRTVVVPAPGSHWPPRDVLRQGNRANGWILLDIVPLIYELWRQLNGFPADLPKEAAEAAGLKKS